MREVPAHAPGRLVRMPGGLGRVGIRVAKLDASVDVIADRMDQWPSLGDVTEFRPRELDETVGLAVTAAEQIDQRFDGELFQRMLHMAAGATSSGAPRSAIRKSADSVSARRRVDDVTDIAKAVAIRVGRNFRIKPYPVGDDKIARTRGMHAEHQDHRRRLRTLIGDFVTGAYFDQTALRRAASVSACVTATSALAPLSSKKSVTRPP